MRKRSYQRAIYWGIFFGVLISLGIIFSLLWYHQYLKKVFLEPVAPYKEISLKTTNLEGISRKEASHNLARLLIDFGNGKKRAFKGETVSGFSLKDLLDLLDDEGKIKVEFRKKGREEVLEAIEGVKNNSRTWRCYFNGKIVEKNFDKILIKPGDKIKLVYQ